MIKTVQVSEFVEKITTAETSDILAEHCLSVCKAFGYDFYCHVLLMKKSVRDPVYFSLTNYPQAWLEYYVANGCKNRDPIFQHCLNRATPILWESLNDNDKTGKEELQLMEKAKEYGLVSGITFPTHGIYSDTSILSFSNKELSTRDSAEITEISGILGLLASHIHEASFRLFNKYPVYTATNEHRLTDREKECLMWCSEGKSSWEISKILDISESGVTKHIQGCCRKLGVSNRQHAVAKAILIGLFGNTYHKHGIPDNIKELHLEEQTSKAK